MFLWIRNSVVGLKAMTDDKLFWEYHVSDLKGWQSDGAAIYGVRSIPQTFIVDGNGIIIAKNLKGEDLNKFLNSKKIKLKQIFDLLSIRFSDKMSNN